MRYFHNDLDEPSDILHNNAQYQKQKLLHDRFIILH